MEVTFPARWVSGFVESIKWLARFHGVKVEECGGKVVIRGEMDSVERILSIIRLWREKNAAKKEEGR